MRTGTYDRTSDRLLAKLGKPKPFGRFANGRFHTGTLSMHKTPAALLARMFWRLKTRRG